MAEEQLKENVLGMPVAAPLQTPPPGQVGVYGTVAEAKRPASPGKSIRTPFSRA